jgi:4-hydroxybenzoate polyprenyltransferase
VKVLYAQPEFLWLLCPILFYWVIRVWLKTLRGDMPEDPVLFALKDRGSWILLFLTIAIGMAASR